jgi:hypothetical protein
VAGGPKPAPTNDQGAKGAREGEAGGCWLTAARETCPQWVTTVAQGGGGTSAAV